MTSDKYDSQNSNDTHEFAHRLRESFDNVLNSEIARRINSTDATIKAYTDGDHLPTPDILLRITRATGVNLHWLLTGNGSRRVETKALFTEIEEAKIYELARKAGRTFEEELRALALASIETIKRVG